MPAVLQQWIEKSEERNRRIQQLRNEVTEIMELNVMDVTYRMLVEFLADEEIEHISEMDYILRKTQKEIAAIITHVAFYAGWPNGWAVFNLAKEVWDVEEKEK